MSWWRSKTQKQTAAGVGTTDNPDFPLIRLEGVTKIFKGDADDETRALSDLTVDIGRGEYVTVSGPSGCGKSTFLSILALLDSPSSGRYWLNGRATGDLSPSERARTRNVDVGLIFQSFNLIGDMSIYENVEYPLTVRGASAADRRQRVEAALERVGTDGPRETAAGRALGRPPAARRHRARVRRPSADSARRRADRQPRLEERRGRDEDARRAARRRRHRLPRDAQPRLHRPRGTPHLSVRWPDGRHAGRLGLRASGVSPGARPRRGPRGVARHVRQERIAWRPRQPDKIRSRMRVELRGFNRGTDRWPVRTGPRPNVDHARESHEDHGALDDARRQSRRGRRRMGLCRTSRSRRSAMAHRHWGASGDGLAQCGRAQRRSFDRDRRRHHPQSRRSHGWIDCVATRPVKAECPRRCHAPMWRKESSSAVLARTGARPTACCPSRPSMRHLGDASSSTPARCGWRQASG